MKTVTLSVWNRMSPGRRPRNGMFGARTRTTPTTASTTPPMMSRRPIPSTPCMSPRSRGRAIPEADHVRLGPPGRRDLEAEAGQVLACGIGRDAALGCAVEEAEAQQERLVHVLDCLDLLGQDGGKRLDADRPRGELLDDRGEKLPIRRIEALVVDLHCAHRVRR